MLLDIINISMTSIGKVSVRCDLVTVVHAGYLVLSLAEPVSYLLAD